MMLGAAAESGSVQITELLKRIEGGGQDALNDVVPFVYDELKKLARSHLRWEANAGPLQPTALVHEAFLKLVGGRHPSYSNRTHFYGIASRLMRQILVDTARGRAAKKRSSEEVALKEIPDYGRQPDKSVLAIDEALQELERVHPLKSQLIEMHYFGGMTAEESAAVLDMPVHVVRRELRLARAWLHKELAR
jgi:RNA polymerase sigma factor (TIGR02999 family)